jgi:hypothetical protein
VSVVQQSLTVCSSEQNAFGLGIGRHVETSGLSSPRIMYIRSVRRRYGICPSTPGRISVLIAFYVLSFSAMATIVQRPNGALLTAACHGR